MKLRKKEEGTAEVYKLPAGSVVYTSADCQ